MSSTYVPEPPTTGKVILVTTHGELDIELWSRQTPLACKNFIQLCLEGYYDKTIFHRLIPGFMIQGGDPTGTGTGGQSIYGKPFKDQFHQRLKFSHRGLVAMANVGRDTNNSQFFITFGQATHLNKKHTIFGKVIGNTMFNLLSMQAQQTGQNDRPTIPPKIIKTKIIINPFDDIKPRNIQKNEQSEIKNKQLTQQISKKQKQQAKAETKKLKKKNLLSFQDEQMQAQPNKIVSSHDALDDKKLSKKAIITAQQLEWKRKMRQLQQQKKQAIKKLATQQPSQQVVSTIAQGLKQQMKRKHQQPTHQLAIEDDITKFQTRVNLKTGKKQIYWKTDLVQPQQNDESQSQQIDNDQLKQLREIQKKQYDAIKVNQLRFKQVQQGSLNPSDKMYRAQEKALLSNVQKRRMQFLQKRDMQARHGNMLDKLQQFRKRIKSKAQTDVPSWISHKLKFHIDSQNAFKHTERQQDIDDGGLMVVDTTPQQYKVKRKGMDIDQLYRLSKEQ